ncbi:hypothetical protein [Kaistia soli]|uniref:hypothetical protein n=1 Tax=Kaistia soli TaxID=446684 RepID=UPI001114ADDB|nr:hypothetical protein [Kaistia soli]
MTNASGPWHADAAGREAMMKRWLVAAAVAALTVTSTAGAQPVMDGSGAGIDPALIQGAFRSLTQHDKDPYSAQIDRLFVSTTTSGGLSLCGFVNRKNVFGEYEGFRPFGYSQEWDQSFIYDDSEPIASAKALFRRAMARSGCQSILPSG